MSDRAREKGRLAIYSMAGFYLLYMAYSLYGGLSKNSGAEFIIAAIAMVVFVIAGAGLIIFGIKKGYRISKEEQEERKKSDQNDEE